MTALLVAPCDAKAARYAVEHWHYSRAMPIGKLIMFGVWENDEYKGCVLYGRGASPALGAPFGLDQTQVCELVRIALREHTAPVSQIVAQTLRLLKQSNPSLRLVVSFADPNEGHHGGVYQAGGWVYNGTSPSSVEYLYSGKWYHGRMLRPTGWGTVPQIARLTDEQKAQLPRRTKVGKHRYLFPLDRAMRRKLEAISQPYPKADTTR